MSTLHEQARAEAEKRWPGPAVAGRRHGFVEGFLAGHEAATRTRVITTVDELDALPIGSVVLNANGVAFVKTWYDDGGGLQMDRWYATGFEGRWVSEAVIGGGLTSPARVLYEPEASQDLHN
jgi:hypothetical protein